MKHVGITTIILAYLLLAVTYSVVTPLGEGPDEPGHAAYVFFLAREWRLPVQSGDPYASDVPGEGHQPPLAYLLKVPALLWLPPEQRNFDLPGNPRFTWAGGEERNAVAHGSREYLPWRGEVLAWHLARLVSVALGAVTVLCTYATAINLRVRLCDEQPRGLHAAPFALLAAALVAFNPQFLFMSGLITNDALLVTLSAVLLWLITWTDNRRGTTDLRPLAIGVVLGLALITKQSAVVLVPVALLGALLLNWRGSWERRDLQAGLIPALVTLATAALLAGWWYLRNWWLYGDPLALAVFRAEFTTQAFEFTRLSAWVGALVQLHGSFWARFGWMNVAPPAWVIMLFLALELIALTGLLRLLMRQQPATLGFIANRGVAAAQHWRANLKQSPLLRYWPLILLPTITFAWVVSFALTAGLVAWQGRLLFPALPAIAIVLARGLVAAFGEAARPGRTTRWPLVGLLAGLCALALWLPFGVIRPAYPFHTLPEAAAQERITTPVYGRFGRPGDPGAVLRGWRLEGTAHPGATIDITLIWNALGRQNRDWTVFIHVLDADRQIVAEANRKPQDDRFPMTQWVAGDWIEDRQPLLLPPDLAPGTYTIRVGLYDPDDNGRRAARFSADGDLLGDSIDIGQLEVTRDP